MDIPTPRHSPAVQAVEAAIAQIARLEPEVHAFTHHDPGSARIAALAAHGPLEGLTLGVKDIVETTAYPTGYGSEIYQGHTSRADTACVALLEAAGAVTMGKTVTTEFAFFRPGPTRNPHDLSRTPGGSSSGSAAAVAAGMVTLALGSQTAASLTRPASYCGIVGFKPSFGRYSLAGVKGLAPSFDTLGTLGPDVDTIARADAVLRAAVPGPVLTGVTAPRRIGICRTPWWDKAQAGTERALEEAGRLFALHATVEPVDLGAFDEGADLHIRIMGFEAAQALAWEYRAARDRLSPQILDLIEQGRRGDIDDYRAALAMAEKLRTAVDGLFDRYDVLVAPGAPGEAPEGIGATGDPIFSRLWTLLGLPTITMPGLLGPSGLPVGIQLLTRIGSDERLLAHARWAEQILPLRPLPRLARGG